MTLRLGGGTRRELLSRMDAQEYADWEALNLISPIGDDRGDHQAAMIAATVINANPWRDKGAKMVSPLQLMPDHGGYRAEIERRRFLKRSYREKKLREAMKEMGNGS